MTSFNERLNRAMGPRGYDIGLRRSIQSVVLFEAKRCLADLDARRLAENQPGLRAFQRKVVLWETAKNILNATDLLPHQRDEVMWRTGTSKQPLGHDTAWKRTKMIEKELATLADRIRPFQTNDRSSEEAIDLYVQSQYEVATSTKGKPPNTSNWGYSHNNCLMCYRIYYRNGVLDPTLPAPRAPKPIEIPLQRPLNEENAATPGKAPVRPVMMVDGNGHDSGPVKEDDVNVADLEAIVSQDGAQRAHNDDRRTVLQEVREHLELLKEFEDVIPQEELNQRKRDLFLALPAAPPPATKARIE